MAGAWWARERNVVVGEAGKVSKRKAMKSNGSPSSLLIRLTRGAF